MTIALLPTRHPDVNEDVVKLCEHLLERARSGQLRSLACCYTNSDKTVTTSLEMEDDNFAMSHAISALWFRFQTRMQEEHSQVESPNG